MLIRYGYKNKFNFLAKLSVALSNKPVWINIVRHELTIGLIVDWHIVACLPYACFIGQDWKPRFEIETTAT